MKKIYILLFCFLSLTVNAQLISEIEPNPSGTDGSTQNIEIKGTAHTSFTGTLISLESDGANGLVDRLSTITGTFDSNGLLVATIPDLENPSFTLILAESFTGSAGDDLDINDDGQIDNTSIFTNVLDAILVSDSAADVIATSYATQLGGLALAFSSDFPLVEPYLLFRDPIDNAIYRVYNDLSPEIFNAAAEEVTANFGSSAVSPSFGTPNQSFESSTLSLPTINANKQPVIYTTNGTIATQEGEVVWVYNMSGQVVANKNLAYGIYIAIVESNGSVISLKIAF